MKIINIKKVFQDNQKIAIKEMKEQIESLIIEFILDTEREFEKKEYNLNGFYDNL